MFVLLFYGALGVLIKSVIITLSFELYFFCRISALVNLLRLKGLCIQYRFWLLDLVCCLKDLDIIRRPCNPIENVSSRCHGIACSLITLDFIFWPILIIL